MSPELLISVCFFAVTVFCLFIAVYTSAPTEEDKESIKNILNEEQQLLHESNTKVIDV